MRGLIKESLKENDIKRSKKLLSLTMETRQKVEGLIFISPFLIGLILFFLYPLYMSLKLSFGKITRVVGFEVAWKGIENYTRAFLIDINFLPMFLQVIKNTLTEAPLIILLSLLIAILINKDIKCKGFFRTVFFIPFLLGTGEVMRQLLSQGVDKQVLSLMDSNIIPYSILNYFGSDVVMTIENVFGMLVQILWRSGVQILLFLSGLQGISESLYESAKIDGATEWEMLWKITLPMISPILLLNIVYTLVDSFTNMRNPILSYIQDHAFKQTQFEYAAAMGWLYFIFIILLVLVTMGLMRNYIYTTGAEKGGKRRARKYSRV